MEAQENPVSNIYNGKLYEVQDYLSFTGHTYDPNIYFINKRFFDKLPPEYRKILKDASFEVATWQRAQAVQVEKTLLEKLKPYMKINRVSASEIGRFREMCSAVYDNQAPKIDKDVVKAWLEAVK